MKCVRFWGTRGSLPVALTASGVRRKVITALAGAAGRHFASGAELEAYVDTLGMAVAGSYGGHSSCVEIETGGPDYVLCDMGTGLRRFGQQAMRAPWPTGRHRPITSSCRTCTGTTSWGSRFSRRPTSPAIASFIYGGHDGARRSAAAAAVAAVLSGDFAALRADIEFVHLEPGRDYELAGMTVRLMLQRHGGDSYGYRFERGRQDGRLLDRLRAPLADAAETQASSSSSATPTWSSSTRCIRWPTPCRSRPTGDIRATSSASSSARWRARGTLPVPPRADARRRGDRAPAGRDPPHRGDHPHRRTAAGQRRLRRNGSALVIRAVFSRQTASRLGIVRG